MSKEIDVRDVQVGDEVEIVLRGTAVYGAGCVAMALEDGTHLVLKYDDGTLDELWERWGRIACRPKPAAPSPAWSAPSTG